VRQSYFILPVLEYAVEAMVDELSQAIIAAGVASLLGFN
jgi:hypothetical protein